MNVVSWQPDTPSFNSFEDTRGGTGPLTTNYTDGCDGRFRGVLQLGPLGTNVDLSAAGGTTTNANGGAFSEGIDSAEKLVVIRGTKPALIKLSTRLNVADGSGAAFAAAATDIIYTYSAGGTEEISVAIGDNSYEVITAVPDTGGYTKSANNESIHNQIFGRVGSKNATGQIVGLGFASNVQNIVRTNILTGSTTMDASAWSTRETLSGFKGIFTGFINVNGAWFVGTDAGPYYLNDDFQTFEPLIPSLTRSSNHCKNMREHPSLGVIIPLERGIRIFRSVNDNDNVGPDQYWNNTSGVQGRLVSQCYSDQWLYWAIQNSITDTVYICAVRPRRDGDAHANKLSYYPILTLSAVDCDFMEFAGTKGSQTNPTVYYGRDSDAGWFIEGRGNRFPDDQNCTYAASGSWSGTQIRRHRGQNIVPKAFRVRTSGCTSTEKVTLSVDYLDHTGTSQNHTIGAPITSNGVHWLEVTKDKQISTEFLAPKLSLARGGTSTNTPRVLGEIEMFYELEPTKDAGGRELTQVGVRSA